MISTRRSSHLRRYWGRLSPLGALVGAVFLLSGCLSTSSGYTYLTHSNPDKTVTYFKLPSTWGRTTFADDLKAKNPGLSPSQVSQIEAGVDWYVAFGASKRYKPNLQYNYSAYQPQGIAFVEQITPNDKETFSLSILRSQVIGQDPLESQTPDGTTPPFTPIVGSEFTTSTGIRGTKVITYITQPNGIRDEFGQIAEVDPQTNEEFILAIGCRAGCWSANSGTINQILNAWNVKELVHG